MKNKTLAFIAVVCICLATILKVSAQGGIGNVYLSLQNIFTAVQTAPGWYPSQISGGPASWYFDDYITTTAVTGSGINSPTGQSCGASNSTFATTNHPGVQLITSGTGGSGTGDTCVVVGQTPYIINGGNPWIAEWQVIVPVLPGTTAGSYSMAMANGYNSIPYATNYAGWNLSSANTNANHWYCTEFGSTALDSGFTAVASTWYRMSLASDGTNLRWYINGSLVCGPQSLSTLTSAVTEPVFSALALSTTSVSMGNDYTTVTYGVSR